MCMIMNEVVKDKDNSRLPNIAAKCKIRLILRLWKICEQKRRNLRILLVGVFFLISICFWRDEWFSSYEHCWNLQSKLSAIAIPDMRITSIVSCLFLGEALASRKFAFWYYYRFYAGCICSGVFGICLTLHIIRMKEKQSVCNVNAALAVIKVC